jgi:hypothetical protein
VTGERFCQLSYDPKIAATRSAKTLVRLLYQLSYSHTPEEVPRLAGIEPATR